MSSTNIINPTELNEFQQPIAHIPFYCEISKAQYNTMKQLDCTTVLPNNYVDNVDNVDDLDNMIKISEHVKYHKNALITLESIENLENLQSMPYYTNEKNDCQANKNYILNLNLLVCATLFLFF